MAKKTGQSEAGREFRVTVFNSSISTFYTASNKESVVLAQARTKGTAPLREERLLCALALQFYKASKSDFFGAAAGQAKTADPCKEDEMPD